MQCALIFHKSVSTLKKMHDMPNYFDRCFARLSARDALRPGSAKNLIKSNPSHLEGSKDSAAYFAADQECMRLLNEANSSGDAGKKRDFDRAARKVAYGK